MPSPSPTLQNSAMLSLVFSSPVIRQNPPPNTCHVPVVEEKEEEEAFTGVFDEEIDDSFLDKPYTHPEQD